MSFFQCCGGETWKKGHSGLSCWLKNFSTSFVAFCAFPPLSIITLTFLLEVQLLQSYGYITREKVHTHAHPCVRTNTKTLFILPLPKHAPSRYCQRFLIWLFSGLIPPLSFFTTSSFIALFPHLSSSFIYSLFLSQAARGTNWHPAELNVPGAESQMAVAVGRRERRMETTERWRV